MVCEMGGMRSCNFCFFWGGYFQDLFKTVRSTLVSILSSFFSIRFVIVHVVNPCSCIDSVTTLEKYHFILSDISDFHMMDNLSIVVQAFTRRMLTLISEDEMLLPRYVN